MSSWVFDYHAQKLELYIYIRTILSVDRFFIYFLTFSQFFIHFMCCSYILCVVVHTFYVLLHTFLTFFILFLLLKQRQIEKWCFYFLNNEFV